MDLERCDPEIFEALHELLENQAREAERERLKQELQSKIGR